MRKRVSSSANSFASGPKWLKWLLPAAACSAAATFMAARSYRWKESPSIIAAVSFSRRKMLENERVTEVVPAPEEPVMATTGCRVDMMPPVSGTANGW